MAKQKQRYEIYCTDIQHYYDSGKVDKRTEFRGYTYAFSEAQAINNYRFKNGIKNCDLFCCGSDYRRETYITAKLSGGNESMRKPTGYDQAKAFGDYESLPKGNYIVKIIKAEERRTDNGSEYLAVAFDIEEGEQKGFYSRDFKANTSTDKKWRGVYNIFLPVEDGSERDNWTLSALKRDIEAIEDSNQGFHFNWDNPNLIAGKVVGAKFRVEEYEKRNGDIGQAVRCCSFCSASSVRDGSATPAKDRLKKGSSEAAQQTSSGTNETFTPVADDDLPF